MRASCSSNVVRSKGKHCHALGLSDDRVAALSAARSHDTYLAAKYRRIASRRGPVKAIVAVEHAMLIAIWNMITNGVFYDDLGGDYFTQLNPEKTKQRALNQLRQMGFDVTLNPLKATG